MTSAVNATLRLDRIESSVRALSKITDFIGHIDPESLTHSVPRNGYLILCSQLSMEAECSLCMADSVVEQTKPNPTSCECQTHIRARGLASQLVGIANAADTFARRLMTEHSESN